MRTHARAYRTPVNTNTTSRFILLSLSRLFRTPHPPTVGGTKSLGHLAWNLHLWSLIPPLAKLGFGPLWPLRFLLGALLTPVLITHTHTHVWKRNCPFLTCICQAGKCRMKVPVSFVSLSLPFRRSTLVAWVLNWCESLVIELQGRLKKGKIAPTSDVSNPIWVQALLHTCHWSRSSWDVGCAHKWR